MNHDLTELDQENNSNPIKKVRKKNKVHFILPQKRPEFIEKPYSMFTNRIILSRAIVNKTRFIYILLLTRNPMRASSSELQDLSGYRKEDVGKAINELLIRKIITSVIPGAGSRLAVFEMQFNGSLWDLTTPTSVLMGTEKRKNPKIAVPTVDHNKNSGSHGGPQITTFGSDGGPQCEIAVPTVDQDDPLNKNILLTLNNKIILNTENQDGGGSAPLIGPTPENEIQRSKDSKLAKLDLTHILGLTNVVNLDKEETLYNRQRSKNTRPRFMQGMSGDGDYICTT